jgi:hypothetical protein
MGMNWTKFRRKALVMRAAQDEMRSYLADGTMNENARRKLREKMRSKYGFWNIGGAAGFTSLSGGMTTTFTWNAQVALTGSAYNPSTNSSSIIKRQAFGTAIGTNTQSGGCDECFSFQQAIAGGGSATLSFLAMTDLLQRANSTIARIKGYQFRVLSGSDDSTISPTPTATRR